MWLPYYVGRSDWLRGVALRRKQGKDAGVSDSTVGFLVVPREVRRWHPSRCAPLRVGPNTRRGGTFHSRSPAYFSSVRCGRWGFLLLTSRKLAPARRLRPAAAGSPAGRLRPKLRTYRSDAVSAATMRLRRGRRLRGFMARGILENSCRYNYSGLRSGAQAVVYDSFTSTRAGASIG
jgi:hypothetical protein